MPRRSRSQSDAPPAASDTLFADLLDDEVGVSGDEAGDTDGTATTAKSGVTGIPPAIAYQPADAASAPETALDDPDLPYWLALNRVRGIGPARFRLLLEGFELKSRRGWYRREERLQTRKLQPELLATRTL